MHSARHWLSHSLTESPQPLMEEHGHHRGEREGRNSGKKGGLFTHTYILGGQVPKKKSCPHTTAIGLKKYNPLTSIP